MPVGPSPAKKSTYVISSDGIVDAESRNPRVRSTRHMNASLATLVLIALAISFAFVIAFAIAFAAAFPATAHANTKEAGWTVTLDSNGTMTSDYASQKSAIDSQLSSLLPGDTFSLTVTLRNDTKLRTSWYMKSAAIETLEQNSEASGGAYTYKLTYGNDVIYESNTVGGDSDEGFSEIDNATGEWFWLGNIDSEGSGVVRLQMTLDGETQDNSYMRTAGEISLSFAAEYNDGGGRRFVEESATPATQPTGDILQTGDVFAMCAVVLLVALVAGGAFAYVSRKRRLGKGSDPR